VDEDPETLGQDRRQAAAENGPAPDGPGAIPRLGVPGDQGIHAEQQVRALFQRDRGMHGLQQDAVQAPAPLDRHRLVEARHRGAGLNRLGDRHMIQPLAAEHHRRPRVQISGDDEQRPLQFPEVVGHPAAGKEVLQVVPDGLIVEQAQRQQGAEPLDAPGQAGRLGAGQRLGNGLQDRPGQLEPQSAHFPEGGHEEDGRIEELALPAVRRVRPQAPEHFHNRDPVGDVGSDEGAGAHAHIDVEAVQVEPGDGLFQGAQGAHFIDAPEHAT